MRCKLAKLVTVVLLITAIGGQWAILQSFAWMGMVVSYAHSGTIKEALTKTFDGKHPCAVCKLVQKGAQQEKHQRSLRVDSKVEYWTPIKAAALDPPPLICSYPPVSCCVLFRSEMPPVPPPRLA